MLPSRITYDRVHSRTDSICKGRRNDTIEEYADKCWRIMWVKRSPRSMPPCSYCDLRFGGLPIASKKMALFPFACGEKN
jgi:hypothetical protein